MAQPGWRPRTSTPACHPDRRGLAPRECRAHRRDPGANKAANSSAPPPAITWKRCWRPTARARCAPPTTGKQRILNIDIGGGTTKLAIIDKGTVQATAAIHVGGRLQVTDANGRITRLDPAGRHHAAVAGFDWKLGDRVAPSDLDTVAAAMAATLMAALRSPPLAPSVRQLYLTDPIEDFGRIDGVIVSGGVGEYVYGREERDFGDMGKRLGLAFRSALAGARLAAVAGRRLHPRHRARRLRIHRPAQRQYRPHQQPRQAAAAAEHAGRASGHAAGGAHRSRRGCGGDPRPPHRLRSGGCGRGCCAGAALGGPSGILRGCARLPKACATALPRESPGAFRSI